MWYYWAVGIPATLFVSLNAVWIAWSWWRTKSLFNPFPALFLAYGLLLPGVVTRGQRWATAVKHRWWYALDACGVSPILAIREVRWLDRQGDIRLLWKGDVTEWAGIQMDTVPDDAVLCHISYHVKGAAGLRDPTDSFCAAYRLDEVRRGRQSLAFPPFSYEVYWSKPPGIVRPLYGLAAKSETGDQMLLDASAMRRFELCRGPKLETPSSRNYVRWSPSTTTRKEGGGDKKDDGTDTTRGLISPHEWTTTMLQFVYPQHFGDYRGPVSALELFHSNATNTGTMTSSAGLAASSKRTSLWPS